MSEKIFIESIKLKDGVFYNLPLHRERMLRTTSEVFGRKIEFNLSTIQIPSDAKKGLFKCRILYSEELLSIEFQPYFFKEIKSVALVYDNEISYPYKSADRTSFDKLIRQSGTDEILIVKNDCITDTSISNVVFQNSTGLYTPSTCLLEGVKREFLLEKGVIEEKDIRLQDLKNYDTMYLINAMIDIEDNIIIPVDKIL